MLYHQLEQQPAQPVTEHTQRALQHFPRCMRQVCACLICVNIAIIEPYRLFNKLTLAAAVVHMGIYFYHLFCFVCEPKCVLPLVCCHSYSPPRNKLYDPAVFRCRSLDFSSYDPASLLFSLF